MISCISPGRTFENSPAFQRRDQPQKQASHKATICAERCIACRREGGKLFPRSGSAGRTGPHRQLRGPALIPGWAMDFGSPRGSWFYRDAAVGRLVRTTVPGGKLILAGAVGRIAGVTGGALSVAARAAAEFWMRGGTAPTTPLVRASRETALVALSVPDAGGIALKLGSPRLKVPLGRLKVLPLEGAAVRSGAGTVAVAAVSWVGTCGGATILIGVPGAVEFATWPTSGIARSTVKAYMKEFRYPRWRLRFMQQDQPHRQNGNGVDNPWEKQCGRRDAPFHRSPFL